VQAALNVVVARGRVDRGDLQHVDTPSLLCRGRPSEYAFGSIRCSGQR
jgi:hypothetical protein